MTLLPTPFEPAPGVFTLSTLDTVRPERVEPTITPLRDVAALEREWRDLEERANGSFFLSWLWIGTWLEGLPTDTTPLVLRGAVGGRTVALGLFLPKRGGGLAGRQLFLHETGDTGYDGLTIEYNGLLTDRHWTGAALSTCLSCLLRWIGPARAVRLSNLTEPMARAMSAATVGVGGGAVTRRTVVVYQVDLRPFWHGAGPAYLATLGTNTRAALRRSLRLYAERGAPTLYEAQTVAEAMAFYEALKAWHTARWVARGWPGAFTMPAIDAFHRRLIARGVPTGAVRLCRVSAGTEIIGYLYNFAWKGRVYNYQSGFHFPTDNRLKPGMVSHYLAIENALARGDTLYDFMAGESSHKPRLAQPTDAMVDLLLLPRAYLARAVELVRYVKAVLLTRK